MEGSPLLVMADSARQAKRDELIIKYGGGPQRSAALTQEAGLQSLYSQQYSRAGAIGAGSSLLNTTAGLARHYAVPTE
jgi:hypothetical protein